MSHKEYIIISDVNICGLQKKDDILTNAWNFVSYTVCLCFSINFSRAAFPPNIDVSRNTKKAQLRVVCTMTPTSSDNSPLPLKGITATKLMYRNCRQK